MNASAAPPPPPPPPRERRFTSRVRRFETFVRDYTAGVDESELRRLVDRDAPRVYSVLMRDRGEAPPAGQGLRRRLWDVKLLFLSVSEKLTPARRLLFAGSLLAALWGLFGLEFAVNTPDYGFKVDASPLPFLFAVAGLVFLLATELVDRVLVRDELEVARQLQRELLPKVTPEIPGWALAHSLRTANDIGGDYVRFEPLAEGRWAIVIADASGHGMAAGLLMAITDTALRIALELDARPEAVARLLHRALRRTGDRRAFVTLFCGILDPASGRLDFACAGHPSPLVRRAEGPIEEPVTGSLPAGSRESFSPATGTVELAPGDLLVLFTDGLFEALNASDEAFGWERVRREVASSGGDAEAAHARLRAAVEAHVGREALSDDCTIVTLERRSAG